MLWSLGAVVQQLVVVVLVGIVPMFLVKTLGAELRLKVL